MKLLKRIVIYVNYISLDASNTFIAKNDEEAQRILCKLIFTSIKSIRIERYLMTK